MSDIRDGCGERSADLAALSERMKRVDRRAFLVAAASGAFALGAEPWALAARRDGGQVAFVTADLESHVVVLSLPGGKVLGRIRTARAPRSIESVHGRSAVVAHTEPGLVSIVDPFARDVRFELDGFSAPRYTAVDPLSSVAYVTDSTRQEVVALDVDRGRVVSRTRVPGPARHVTIGPDGSTLWTALGSKAERIAILDLRDPRPRLERTIATPFPAHDVVFAPRDRHVWVTSGEGRRIAVYRADTREIVRILSADRAPQHVAFVGGLAFVSSGDDGLVRVHRLNGELVHRTEVPVGSYNIALGNGRAVTPSLSQGTVALLDERGRVRVVRRIARAAHDACIVDV
jgi:DNA-binding beta-propeller fold protein YncE